MDRWLIVALLCVCLASAAVGKKKTKSNLAKREKGSCGPNEFQCQNQQCVQAEYTCDTDNDCGDFSDEKLPECPPAGQCTSSHEVSCSNGGCVPVEYRCDGDDDCGDGTDETGCDLYQCVKGEVKCSNNLCVELEWMCDGDDDCGNGWDEQQTNCATVGSG